MWIGSLKGSKEEAFGIEWPKIPIKALGMYFTYDRKLLKEKNFIERLDSIKKTYQYLVLKGPNCLRQGDNNQILSDSKVCVRFLDTTCTKKSCERTKSIAI